MKLGVFVSELGGNEGILERLKGENMGVFLVQNGVYHAMVSGNGNELLQKIEANYYCLTEDLQTRGLTAGDVDSKVNVVTYGDVVDLMMNTYEKLVWL